MNFHEVRFPTDISRGAQGGPERRTDVVALGSGHEQRNSRWADSRRRYNAGYGIKTLSQLYAVVNFFEERRGRLYGFRWRDHGDWTSAPPGTGPSPIDQLLAIGDGLTTQFQLQKTYGGTFAPWLREITKPVTGTVRIAIDGSEQIEGSDFTVDTATGVVTFLSGSVPASGLEVRAGFEFDVPVRFDSDQLETNVTGFQHGAIPQIPIVEVRV